MTSHPRKNHPHVFESGVRRGVCACFAVPLSATRTPVAGTSGDSPWCLFGIMKRFFKGISWSSGALRPLTDVPASLSGPRLPADS